jgi:TPR repeat protein
LWEGVVVPQDRVEALTWARRGVERDNVDAQVMLAAALLEE